MIPIRSHSRIERTPFVTWLLMAACLAAALRIVTLPDERALGVLGALAVVPSRFAAAPWSPEQLVTLVSSAFLHAGWLHLGGNLLFLWVFGPAVENQLGHLGYLLAYLASAAVGSLAHVAVDPTSTMPLVGASGAIAGILGAHLLLEPRVKITTVVPIPFFFEVAELPAAFVIGIWFLMQVASGLAPLVPGEAASVAWFAHIGGFGAGSLIGLAARLANPRRNNKTRPRKTGSRS